MTPNPLIAELLSHKWAMEENALKAFFEMNLPLLVEAAGTSAVVNKPTNLQITNGIAVIKISGVLLKTVPGWMRYWGIEATGYDEINEQLVAALNSEQVTGIHLQVSSPGGVVDGLADTADAILAARSQKPMTATIEDLGASAAYWLTSQAETIKAGRTTEVGSIGVYTVYADMSKMAEEMGIKIIVIKSGEHKGMGVPGAEITEKQIEAVQEVVDQIADSFISAVAEGRDIKKSEVKKWATGRLWIAKTALSMGLIDTVTSKSEVRNQKSEMKGQAMDNEQKIKEQAEVEARAKIEAELAEATKEARAEERERLGELNAAFPDNLEFAAKAFGDGKTIQEAKAEYCDVLQKQVKETAVKTEKGETKEKASGAKAISTGDTDSEGQGDFMAEARQLVEDGKAKTMTIAMRKISRSKPALHQAYKEKCEIEPKANYGEEAA